MLSRFLFSLGKFGEYLSDKIRDAQPSSWPVVNEKLAALPQTTPITAVVESSGLKYKGDGVHFDTPSLSEFGKRYAEAMRWLQK